MPAQLAVTVLYPSSLERQQHVRTNRVAAQQNKSSDKQISMMTTRNTTSTENAIRSYNIAVKDIEEPFDKYNSLSCQTTNVQITRRQMERNREGEIAGGTERAGETERGIAKERMRVRKRGREMKRQERREEKGSESEEGKDGFGHASKTIRALAQGLHVPCNRASTSPDAFSQGVAHHS